MVHIVGIHGIWQAKMSQSRLTGEWRKAIHRGLDGVGELHDCGPALDVPHWSSLLARGADRLGAGDDPFDAAVPLREEEVEFASGALEEILGPDDVARSQELSVQTLGLPQLWPSRLTRLVMAYDRRFSRGGGALFVKAMREVRYYLYEPDLADQVQGLVADSFGAATSVVLGHSLGSVIAYDLLSRGKTPLTQLAGVRTLVTCGSPLGIPSVRRGLGITEGEALKLPSEIRWINVFDPSDFITGGGGLNAAPAVVDAEVDNGIGDPHSALRYLRTVPVARAIAGTEQ
ncbi:hypothetical protein AB0B50_04070 [Streptomyces sp. NPDC041068]|uniref:hypothetical protein n=1 Tax=Streptomyces sp. NPDC041068 TaxID=3155130 RepID=UPI0033F3BB5D